MCGFVGMMWRDASREADAAQLRPALDAIAHRGPDGESVWQRGPVALGHRRLSILDTTDAGLQPMVSATGDLVIAFNGEIYNFLELRAELEADGAAFRTETDTEVILEAWARWGADCLPRLNGMWAFALVDRRAGELVLCRDRFGIKPLYVGERGDRWLFGSELQSVRRLTDESPQLDERLAVDFLRSALLDHEEDAMVRGWRRLPPGTLLRLPLDGRPGRSARFFDFRDVGDRALRDRLEREGDHRAERELVDRLRAAFEDAVRLRLRADVPLGTCLSGGLDSTGIVCAAAAAQGGARAQHARHAFSVVTDAFDETRYIDAVVDATGVQLSRARVDPNTIASRVERMFEAQDEPPHSLTALAGYLVFEAAHEAGVTVLLNGQGADELLAGYGGHRAPWAASTLRARRAGLRQQLAAEGLGRAALLDVARALSTIVDDRTAQIAHLRRLRARRGLLSTRAEAAAPPRPVYEPPWREPDPLRGALAQSVMFYPLPVFLRVEDRNSMAHGREARLPFLDPAFAEVARTLPTSMLRRDGLNKWAQREAFRGLLPEVVRARPDKMGFPVPAAQWIRGPLRELWLDRLSERRLRARGLYRVPETIRARDAVLRGDALVPPGDVYRIFLLEAWAAAHLTDR